jgi:hypothetical protein
MVERMEIKTKSAASLFILQQVEEFEALTIVVLVIQLLLLPLNGMRFLVNLKSSKDCLVHVNKHGMKRYFWNKHFQYRWESQSTVEGIFSTDFAPPEPRFSIDKILFERSESLSPHYEWAE